MTKEFEQIVKSLMLFKVDKINPEQRTLTACISTDQIDRHNEIVTAKALADAMPEFAKNPIACATHYQRLESGEPPVIGSWLTETFVQQGGKSYMDLRFAATELAEKYWQLYRDKHMRAFSISFYPREYSYDSNKDGRVVIYDKIELIEISPVAVGANRGALAKMFENEKYDDHWDWLKKQLSQIDSLCKELSQIKQDIKDTRQLIELSIDTKSDDPEFARQLLDSGPAGSTGQGTDKAAQQAGKRLLELLEADASNG
jgi:hypothetical protein